MTAGFIGLLSLTCGLLAGYVLCKEQVWRLESETRELRRDLAHATGHPSTLQGNVTVLPSQRRVR